MKLPDIARAVLCMSWSSSTPSTAGGRGAAVPGEYRDGSATSRKHGSTPSRARRGQAAGAAWRAAQVNLRIDRNFPAEAPQAADRRVPAAGAGRRGGFGTVWRGLDLRLIRTVALKVPHAHLIETGDEVARFFREARVVGQLRHPGIVTLHEVLVLDGLPSWSPIS